MIDVGALGLDGATLVVAVAWVVPAVAIAVMAARLGIGRAVALAVGALVSLAVATLGAELLAPAAHDLSTGPRGLQAAMLARELALGAALGVTAAVPLVAGELVGAWLAAALGDGDDAPWASVTGLVAALVFFALGGHRAVIAAVVGSYRFLPPGAADASAMSVVDAGATLFAVAVTLAVPVLGAIAVAALVLGAVERAGGTAVALAPMAVLVRLAAVLALAALVFALAHGVAALVRDLPMTLAG